MTYARAGRPAEQRSAGPGSAPWRGAIGRSGRSARAGRALPIELGLDRARLRDQLAVAGDRLRDPVDVRRVQQLHLAQRVTAELAEVERGLARVAEGRRGVATPG